MELSFYLLTIVVGGLASVAGLLARHSFSQAMHTLDLLRADIQQLAARVEAVNAMLVDHESRLSKLEVQIGQQASR